MQKNMVEKMVEEGKQMVGYKKDGGEGRFGRRRKMVEKEMVEVEENGRI